MSGLTTSQRRIVSLSPRLRASLTSLLAEGRRIDAVKLIRRDHNISLREALSVVDEYSGDRFSRFMIDPPADHHRPSSALSIAAAIFLVVGVCLGGSAIWLHRSNERLAVEGLVIQGKVIGLQSNGRSTAPIIGYTVNEARYQYRSNAHSSLIDYEVGDSVRLLVNPETPHSPLIDDALHRYAGVVILSMIAAGMMLAFCVSLALTVSQP